MHTTSAILAVCGGFLLAVLWMDLMFDVQVLRHRDEPGELSEAVLASIAGYYRRVTTICRDHPRCPADIARSSWPARTSRCSPPAPMRPRHSRASQRICCPAARC